MNEALKQASELQYPEIDTENQALHSEFVFDGYNVAIFYTRKESKMARYVKATVTDIETSEQTHTKSIAMVDSYELLAEDNKDEWGNETGLEVIPDESEIDVADTDALYIEIEYTIRTLKRMKRSLIQ